MFHSVLAKEHSSNSKQNDEEADDKEDESSREQKQSFKVLNYAPGLCDTQMTDDLAGCSVLDDGLHKILQHPSRRVHWCGQKIRQRN